MINNTVKHNFFYTFKSTTKFKSTSNFKSLQLFIIFIFNDFKFCSDPAFTKIVSRLGKPLISKSFIAPFRHPAPILNS